MVLECSRPGYRLSGSLFARLSAIRVQISTGIIFIHQSGDWITAETQAGGVRSRRSTREGLYVYLYHTLGLFKSERDLLSKSAAFFCPKPHTHLQPNAEIKINSSHTHTHTHTLYILCSKYPLSSSSRVKQQHVPVTAQNFRGAEETVT